MCRFGRLFMFKSNCEGSHGPAFVFNTRDLPSWPTRQTVVQRAASAKRAPWPIAALAPNALPNGVLVHRSSRLDPPVCVFTLAPPVPSQVLSVLALPECAHVRVPRDKCAVVGTWCETHFSATCVGLRSNKTNK